MFSPETIEVLSEAGVGIVAVVVVGVLFWRFLQLYTVTTETHRIERNEWRTSMKETQDNSTKAITELSNVIRDINSK